LFIYNNYRKKTKDNAREAARNTERKEVFQMAKMITTTKERVDNTIAILEEQGAYKLNVSRSNKKLVPNEKTAFIIWNLPAVKTCPFATDLCKASCYAKKAETAYPSVLPCRTKNFEESKKDDFANNMAYTILKIAKGCRKEEIIVRIHESGDFYNQEYTNKWYGVMALCSVDPRIKFIAYTKSFKYFNGKGERSYFSLRASIWADTKADQLAMIKANNWNIYTAVDKFTEKDTFTQCRCEDCATCGKCWGQARDIRCEIH